jgi:molybdate/tungstate transport system permease protein
MTQDWRIKVLFLFLSGFILLFILAPIASMLIQPGLEAYWGSFGDQELMRSIRLTMLASMLATLLFGVLSIPLAWILARKEFPFKKLINGLITIPIIIPHSAAGIALLGIISRGSLLGRAGEQVGISFVGGTAGIVLAMAFVSLPFAINAARDGFHAVPEKLEKAALNLGASPLRTFFTISVPLAKKQIITGLAMMWGRGLSEFGAVVIIAYHPMTTPVLIWERFTSFGLSHARPAAAIFVVLCLLVFSLMHLLTKQRHHAGD